jgi:AcrR family transcriptional regulator
MIASPSLPIPAASAAPLRQRLIDVTVELVDREGIESLTLRRIARRAGVSHGAPLRHFDSLSDLLAEVAAHGFRLLSAGLDEHTAALPDGASASERLGAAGRAYVQVAVENPGLFALMFRPDRLEGTNAQFRQDADAAFERLMEHVQSAQAAGWQADRDTRLLSGIVWSSVHGLATLWSQGAMQGPVPDASLDDALALSLELMMASDPQRRT